MDETFYKTQDLCDLFQVSHQTVKVWAKEFSAYLSPTALPPAGKTRLFTEDDAQVLALIHQFREQGYHFADIHPALQAGQRGEIPTPTLSDKSAMIPPQMVIRLRDEIDMLRAQLTTSNKSKDEAEGQVRLLKEQLAQKEADIRQLYRELARYEAKED